MFTGLLRAFLTLDLLVPALVYEPAPPTNWPVFALLTTLYNPVQTTHHRQHQPICRSMSQILALSPYMTWLPLLHWGRGHQSTLRSNTPVPKTVAHRIRDMPSCYKHYVHICCGCESLEIEHSATFGHGEACILDLKRCDYRKSHNFSPMVIPF